MTNQVLARCTKTKRVLVSGPEVAPNVLRWVEQEPRHRTMRGFKTAVLDESEKAAYATIVMAHYESVIAQQPYADDGY